MPFKKFIVLNEAQFFFKGRLTIQYCQILGCFQVETGFAWNVPVIFCVLSVESLDIHLFNFEHDVSTK